MGLNQITISGKIVDRSVARYTLASIIVIEFTLHHVSDQEEANTHRTVEFELAVIAMAEVAKKIIHIESDTHINLSGFITKKNRWSNQLVLHALDVKPI